MGITILVAIFIFIIGLALINFLMPEITRARASLSCDSPNTISDGAKVLCLVIGTVVPYWILLIFSLLVGAIASRITGGSA